VGGREQWLTNEDNNTLKEGKKKFHNVMERLRNKLQEGEDFDNLG